MTVAAGAPLTNHAAEIISGGAVVVGLPRTRECADVARTVVGDLLRGLLPGRLGDGVVMASELAANAFIHGLKAKGPKDVTEPEDTGEYGEHRQAPAAGWSELTLYRRGAGPRAELVCTVFDPRPDVDAIPERTPCVLAGLPDKPSGATLPGDVLDDLLEQLETGKRGLDVVRMLSEGRTGFYRTKSRLGSRPISGKAAWFALPIPADSPAARPPTPYFSPAQAVKELRSRLDDRGIGRMYHNDLPGQSVLSAPHLTVWCHGTSFMWRTSDGVVRHPFSDLVEAAEQVISVSEDREYARLGGPLS
jgi:hypothetical protein